MRSTKVAKPASVGSTLSREMKQPSARMASLDAALRRLSDELNSATSRAGIEKVLSDHEDLAARLSERGREIVLKVVEDLKAKLPEEA